MNQSFEERLAPLYVAAFRYCVGIAKNRTEADDIFQEALLKAFQAYTRLKNSNAFKTWLYKIISNTAMDYFRQKVRHPMSNFDMLPISSPFYNEDLDLKLDIRDALDQLSEKERECILLYEISGMTLIEIKEVQKALSLSAIKSRLSRAREKFQACFLGQEPFTPSVADSKNDAIKEVL